MSWSLGHYIFGSSMAAINIFNVQYKANRGTWNDVRYYTISGFKGWAYGVCFPFSAIWIGIDALTGPEIRIKKHFVPLSVYGSIQDRMEK